MNDLLIYLSILYTGNNFEIYKALKNGKKIDINLISEEIKKIKQAGVETLTIFDENYPNGLKELKYSPFVIYYKGNIDLLKENMVSLTGDVDSDLTSENIKNTCKILAKKSVLLTNSFKNLDEKIIKEFKKHNAKIIYLLAEGISKKWDEIDKKNELCISIYPPNAHPKLKYFKERNVLNAALSNFLIIFSSKKNSGIINLANCFANMGKEVYCYPSIDYEDGNNFLIKSGANLLTHIGDVSYY
ncbi:DNA-processing protein DprA [Mycoplasma tauri]|uniref:DNA-processing protein DprA n=1 Tax=Mycoplasma tauri TaxID=547987 RepID=A0A953ND29_9MOLU|nr:DNA-processing protein DprA [Mycoplasma tauri]MBZ4195259.1 DNA-processing protein DprA [Mycoplasma tauri]MBZ4218208.1 DNA-processing protein DprA [Mycoplasma tauri]